MWEVSESGDDFIFARRPPLRGPPRDNQSHCHSHYTSSADLVVVL